MQRLLCPICNHGFGHHVGEHCDVSGCSSSNKLDKEGIWVQGGSISLLEEKKADDTDNFYMKLVEEKKITNVDDLTKFAEIRINTSRLKASTAIVTIIAILAILISAYYAGIQAAEKVANMPLGWRLL